MTETLQRGCAWNGLVLPLLVHQGTNVHDGDDDDNVAPEECIPCCRLPRARECPWRNTVRTTADTLRAAHRHHFLETFLVAQRPASKMDRPAFHVHPARI